MFLGTYQSLVNFEIIKNIISPISIAFDMFQKIVTKRLTIINEILGVHVDENNILI